ncbi:hypothetical protein A0H81_11292 [Grifola frondosa]|uniref:Uncharacterized protein n=1 Tax=Grifola frondosa TaxID=5627 RepID=A0A1C7LWJ7_GRIFR|nr:hypothetical protein A0H81_11292 [Grifola frondosa]
MELEEVLVANTSSSKSLLAVSSRRLHTEIGSGSHPTSLVSQVVTSDNSVNWGSRNVNAGPRIGSHPQMRSALARQPCASVNVVE